MTLETKWDIYYFSLLGMWLFLLQTLIFITGVWKYTIVNLACYVTSPPIFIAFFSNCFVIHLVFQDM